MSLSIQQHQGFMRCVQEFMDAFQQPYLHVGFFGSENFPTKEVVDARMAMLREEMDELEVAERRHSDVDALDAIVDILYVMYGGALECGFVVESGLVAENFNLTSFYGWPDGMDTYTSVLQFIGSILRPRIEVFGVELIQTAFMEVHRSNMSKIWKEEPVNEPGVSTKTKDGWILKRNGKVVKPPTYSKANLAKILEESGYRYRKKILASF